MPLAQPAKKPSVKMPPVKKRHAKKRHVKKLCGKPLPRRQWRKHRPPKLLKLPKLPRGKLREKPPFAPQSVQPSRQHDKHRWKRSNGLPMKPPDRPLSGLPRSKLPGALPKKDRPLTGLHTKRKKL